MEFYRADDICTCTITHFYLHAYFMLKNPNHQAVCYSKKKSNFGNKAFHYHIHSYTSLSILS